MHLAPPCTSWSQARPPGSPEAPTVQLGLGCVDFSIKVLRACRLVGVTVSLENPASSRIWKHPGLARELGLSQCIPYYYDTCRYGAPYKKPTIFSTNKIALDGHSEAVRP